MKQTITVESAAVLEARPLAELVGVANRFSSRIELSVEDRTINAKSIMGVIGLGIDVGTKVAIEAIGEDAAAAIQAICEFLTTE